MNEVRHHCARLVLAPILLVQAIRVRRAVPRLPEAAGEREGEDGAGPRLRILVLGDSSAAGVGAATQSEALVGRLVAALRPAYSVHWKLIAQTGWTSADAIQHLRNNPAASFDIAVIALGVNDVTAGRSLRIWLRNLAELAGLLRNRYSVRHILMSGLPPMHAFPALPHPLRWYLGASARRLDRVLAAWAGGQGDCSHVALDFGLDPALAASDGFHPGPSAYAIWAEAMASRIRELWGAPAAASDAA
ncbi:MAG TPA: SGNH/GDSL hydrolase family protein [Nevskia sp.]|nr:SGNH/GDSL hydrolase family protein [Nevskia sp.]